MQRGTQPELESQAIGLRLELTTSAEDGDAACTTGITGDTGWTQAVSAAFCEPRPVDLLVLHTGSVYRQDRAPDAYARNHLGWNGAARLLRDLAEAHEDRETEWLVVVSEWGEELAEHRTEVCRGLQRYATGGRVIPGEQGLYIGLPQCRPVCQVCKREFATHWVTGPYGEITHVCDHHIHGATHADGSPDKPQV